MAEMHKVSRAFTPLKLGVPNYHAHTVLTNFRNFVNILVSLVSSSSLLSLARKVSLVLTNKYLFILTSILFIDIMDE